MAINKSSDRQQGTLSQASADIIPRGVLLQLKPQEIIPSKSNPRHLFDREPLNELKKNISEHGVLVPITVFKPKGQSKYSILDGQRRHRCCQELQAEGREITIPANIVEPPTKIAGLLYMFSIHNFREDWELMPTALGLRTIMTELNETDNLALTRLTGLSEPQINRCKKLLEFPDRFQNLSLDPDPKTRIPSNFWIELHPMLALCEKELPSLVKRLGKDGVIDKLVEKYRAKKIKSVIHFRRIMEAFQINDQDTKQRVLRRVEEYIEDVGLETRRAFDEFVVDNRRIQGAVQACNDFIRQIERSKLDYTIEREEIREALEKVRNYAQEMLNKLEGSDAPEALDSEE